MEYETIGKEPADTMDVTPNLPDVDAAREGFQWSDMYKELDWLPGGFLNQAHECIDRHVNAGRGAKTALIWVGKNGEEERYTFSDMKEQTNKFANVLQDLGVEKGERVFVFMERLPELYFAIFGALKLGAVVGPLFSAFGPDPVRDRMQDSGATVLIAQPDLKRRVSEMLTSLPDLKHTIIVNKDNRDTEPLATSDLNYETLMADASSDFTITNTSMYDYSVIHYTSGTTGKPKGAVHRHVAVVQQYATGKWALDLHPDDIYWCTADPGWVTGTSYGMFAPWSNGVTQIIYEGGFSARAWYEVIQKYNVTVWYTAPTAIRALMREGEGPVNKTSRKSLRLLGTVGEPINPEAWEWYFHVVGEARCPIVDTWWQTETGGTMIVPLPGTTDMKPGAGSHPFFGVKPVLVDAEGNVLEGATDGNLLITDSWPGQMRTVYGDHQRFIDTYFTAYPGTYFTGDGCRRDEDGFYWITGRVDDVINVSGHRMGTAEVESALVSHDAVAEAAVVGYPHDVKGQGIYAYVTLRQGVEVDDALVKNLIQHVRQEIGPIASPDLIQIAPGLPKTRSGKIMRRILRKIAENEYSNLGDTSTLAEPEVVDDLINNRQNR